MMVGTLVFLEALAVTAILRVSPEWSSVDFTRCYEPAAKSLLEGKSPRNVEGQLLTAYPPGFPALIAVGLAFARWTGLTLRTVILAGNLLCNVVTILAAFQLARRLSNTGTALVAAAIAGLCPSLLYMCKGGYAQVPYLAIFSCSVFSLVVAHQSGRYVWFVVTGVLLGLTGLIRPDAIAYLAILVLYLLIFFRGSLVRRVARPGLVLLGFALTILPWSMFVYGQTGRVVVLGSVMTSHLQGEAPLQSSADADGVQGLKHFPALVRSPLSHAGELFRRAGKAWFHTDSGRHEAAALVMNLLAGALLVLGLWKGRSRGRRWAWGILLACFLGSWGMSTLTVFLARYLATGWILSAPIQAVGLVWLLRQIRLWRDRQPLAPETEKSGVPAAEGRSVSANSSAGDGAA